LKHTCGNDEVLFMQDAECDRANVPRALFMDHVFAHLLMTYGAKNMVAEFAACLMVTVRRHKAFDLRLEVSYTLICQLHYCLSTN